MAGGDILGGFRKSHTGASADLAGRMRVVKPPQAIYQIRRIKKPVLASVQGAAAGFGLSLILNSDLAIASAMCSSRVRLSPHRAQRRRRRDLLLPRVVGERKALEIALLGERFPAQEAKQQNILNWVVPRISSRPSRMIACRLAYGPTSRWASPST